MDGQTGFTSSAEYQPETFTRDSDLHSDSSYPLEDIDVNRSGSVRELPEHGTTVVTNGHASIASIADDENIDRRHTHSVMSRRESSGDARKLEGDQSQEGHESGYQGKSSFETQAVTAQGTGEFRPRAMVQANQELASTLGDAANLGEDHATSILDHEPNMRNADDSVRHSVESAKDEFSEEDPRPSKWSNPLSQ